MKKLLFLLFISFFCSGFIDLTYSQTASLDRAVDSLFKANMVDTSVGTAIGVIIKNPQTGVFIKKYYCFGEKNRETHVAPDSTTVFQIGSVTKTFTAMIMAHMLRNNLIKRNDRINPVLAPFVSIPYWRIGNDTTFITFLDLVTHYSGLIDEPNNVSYPYTLQRMYSYLDTCHLLSKPDSLWLYSNLGFATLATGLTVKAGRDSIEQLFSQWITDSLGMTSTKITRTQDMINRSAKGYIKNGSGSWIVADSNKSTWPAFNGAGAIRSTIKDMTRYMEYQMRLVNSTMNPLLDTMHKRIKPLPGLNTWQGMAWAQHHLNHQPSLPWTIYKDGGTPGYNSYIAFYTDTATDFKAGVVILTNSGTTANFNNAQKVENITMNILSFIYPKYGVNIRQISSVSPDKFILKQNFPNPFNPVTKIKFELPKASFVKLTVFNSVGREVKTIISQNLSKGSYETDFSGEDLPSGVYFYKIKTADFTETKRMMLIK